MSNKPLRIGLLGASDIARQFAVAIASSETVVAQGVASRSMAKARAFAKEAGIELAYGSYEEMLRDPAIDAVYVALPNSLHAEWSILAAQAGKHVLCEKPLCLDAAQAIAMFSAARTAGVHLAEAYPYMAQPQTITMLNMLKAGAIGRVKLIQASFGYSLPNPATNFRMSAKLGGGARLDTGTYPVSFVRMVAGELPSRVIASANWASEGVDRSLTAMLEFPSGILAHVSGSFETAWHRHAFIGGDAGAILTSFANHGAADQPLELHIKKQTLNVPYEVMRLPGVNGFRAEAESFAKLVGGDLSAWSGLSPRQSIDTVLMMDAIGESLRTGHWVSPKPDHNPF